MARSRQNRAQRDNRRLINGISKGWKITRTDRRPRGLENIGNNCYRHGALQPLLHLPRFVNWIRQHNEKGKGWPCNSDYSRQFHDTKGDPIRANAVANLIGDCVPCMLKELAIAYWSGEETVIRHTNPAIQPIHRYAGLHFCRDPPNIEDLRRDSRYASMSGAEQLAYDQRKRRMNMTAQQDADDFLMSILSKGCEDSLNKRNAATYRRLAEYKALFKTVLKETRTCSNCHADIGYISQAVEFGYRLQPLQTGRDTIEAAFVRAMTETLESSRDKDPRNDNKISCPKCKAEYIDLTCTKRIVSAPEYMRIYLNLSTEDGRARNTNPIQIPDILDITNHVIESTMYSHPTPLRYKLIGVTYHSGPSLNSGHYTAGVTGPGSADGDEENTVNRFFINDSKVFERRETDGGNALTRNPYRHQSARYDPYMLFYEYIPNNIIGEKEEKKKAVLNSEPSIAERIRDGGLRRKGRGKRAGC